MYICTMLVPLNFPKTKLKLIREREDLFVWDIFRKKKLLVTPEEWVRQHVLHFLCNVKNVPLPLIASEYSLKINKLDRRCDGVIFNRRGEPIAVIECKAPQVKLTEKVFFQIAQYNFALRVKWLIMTNGIETITAVVNQQTGTIHYQPEIPDFSEMLK